MNKIIDLQQRKQMKVDKENEERLSRDKEIKKRSIFTLSLEESYVLINAYIGYVQSMLCNLEDTDDEEEIKGLNWSINKGMSLLNRLFDKYAEASPYENIKMSWNYIDLNETIVSIELGGAVDMQYHCEYESLGKEEKIEIHLYNRLKALDAKRLKTLNPKQYQFYYGEETFEGLKKHKLKRENIRNMNEYKYQQEFKNKAVIIEESHMVFGDEVVLKMYYVKEYPKGFRKILNRLYEEGSAEYKYESVMEFDNKYSPGMYSFPQGWRILAKESIVEVELIKEFNIEYISFSDYKEAQDELEWNIEMLIDQIIELKDECICAGIKQRQVFQQF